VVGDDAALDVEVGAAGVDSPPFGGLRDVWRVQASSPASGFVVVVRVAVDEVPLVVLLAETSAAARELIHVRYQSLKVSPMARPRLSCCFLK
jgi:hypothetical protein